VATEAALPAGIALGFAASFIIGFERELRGSPAGDRTFALVGGAATAIAAVVWKTSPQALAGVVTGSVSSARALSCTARTSSSAGSPPRRRSSRRPGRVVVGTGHLALGVATAGGVLLVLEIRNFPVLRRLDARRYQGAFRDDNDPPRGLRTCAAPLEQWATRGRRGAGRVTGKVRVRCSW
jgi:putative Mg2+ transporter-C (MgtC) family protein